MEQVVRDRLGNAGRRVCLLSTSLGPVLFLAVEVRPDVALAKAHRLAGELEDALRAARPDLVDVVVHTEPEARVPRS